MSVTSVFYDHHFSPLRGTKFIALNGQPVDFLYILFAILCFFLVKLGISTHIDRYIKLHIVTDIKLSKMERKYY